MPEPTRPDQATITFIAGCNQRREEAALRLPPLPSGRRDPQGPITDARGER